MLSEALYDVEKKKICSTNGYMLGKSHAMNKVLLHTPLTARTTLHTKFNKHRWSKSWVYISQLQSKRRAQEKLLRSVRDVGEKSRRVWIKLRLGVLIQKQPGSGLSCPPVASCPLGLRKKPQGVILLVSYPPPFRRPLVFYQTFTSILPRSRDRQQSENLHRRLN